MKNINVVKRYVKDGKSFTEAVKIATYYNLMHKLNEPYLQFAMAVETEKKAKEIAAEWNREAREAGNYVNPWDL